MRLRGLEVTCYSRRLPPYRNSGLLAEIGARYLSSHEMTLSQASVQHGPFDIIFEATGFSPLVFQAAEVLGNKVMVGTVNASHADFVSGVNDQVKAESFFPGWLSKLLTTPVHGLENYAEMLRRLTEDKEAIKVYVEVAQEI